MAMFTRSSFRRPAVRLLFLATTTPLVAYSLVPVSSLPRVRCQQRGFAALPALEYEGKELSPEQLSERLAGKRVALLYSAGWCPMCTSFEPSQLQFRQAAKDSNKEVELIYVPSDRSAAEATQRATALGMLMVPWGEQADQWKQKHTIWAGSEAIKFGFGRRSGVPALVVLDAAGEELAFLPAEAQGARALALWPLDDEKGVW